jgi:ectoine hydroxylase-related dioxygenase (phytanoyl-CoA dioxygenase family)
MPPLTIAEGDLAERARADGYLYLPRLLPRTDDLRKIIYGALTRRGWSVDGRTDPALRLGGHEDARWVEFLNEVMSSAEFHALGRAPEILSVLRTIFADEPQPSAGDVCRLVSPGAIDLTTPPHQDASYLPKEVWAAWLPIDDCPLELGPLAILPGSHRCGILSHPPSEEDPGWCASPLAAGDVIFFSALTVHRALPNRTRDRLRISVDYRYRPR